MITVNTKDHWLKQHAALIPMRTAAVTYAGKISYGDLYDECLMYSIYLSELGIRGKEHIGVLLEHDVGFLKVINALWLIGAVPVLLNRLETDSEIKHKLSRANIKFLVIEDSLKQRFSSIFNEQIIFFTKDDLSRCQIFRPINKPFSFRPSNPAIILFTSGSSGNTKAVVHSFNSLFESVKAIDSFTRLSKNDLWLVSLPLHHIGGFMILCRSLITGSSAAFPKSLKHEHFVEGIKHFHPSYISIVPTSLFKLLNENIIPDKNLKYVFLGGGPSDGQLSINAYDKGWPVVKVYGSSETCSMVSALPPKYLKSKADSSGIPLHKNKIRIKNQHKNKDGKGEILVQALSLFKYYYNKRHPAATHKPGKWFPTGDIGSIDKDGFLFIEARKGEIIISGGENISAKEVETSIKSISGVKDVYVFPVKDIKWGQIVCAVIAAKNVSEIKIRKILAGKISAYKIPKKIYFMREIPRNEMGKVKSEALFRAINLH